MRVTTPAGKPDTDRSYRIDDLTERGRDWMVLWTKSRHEKAVVQHVEASGGSCYLPLVRRTTVTRGRKFVSRVPLFPGYVFLSGTKDDAYAAIETRRVCSVIEVADQPGFVRELEQIRRALEASDSVEPYRFAVVGRRCRVRSGPFMGFEGVITDRLGAVRLVLQLAILGQGAALEIDIDQVEPLD